MSGHGISPTWFGNTKFGEPLVFPLQAIHAIFANCDIDFLGDIFATITIGAVCTLILPPPNTTINLSNVVCSTTFLGDLNELIDVSDVTVIVQVITPP